MRTEEELEDLIDAAGEVLVRRGHDLSDDNAAELARDAVTVTVALVDAHP